MPGVERKSNSYNPNAVAQTVKKGEIVQLYKIFDTASCMNRHGEVEQAVVEARAQFLRTALGIDPQADLESLDLGEIVEGYKKAIETALALENQAPLFHSGGCAERYLDQLLSLEKMRCLLSLAPTKEQVLSHATKLDDESVSILVRLMIAFLKVDERHGNIKEHLESLDRLLRPYFQKAVNKDGHSNFVDYISIYLANFQDFMDRTRGIPALPKEESRVNAYQVAYEALCKKLLPKPRKRLLDDREAGLVEQRPPKKMKNAEADLAEKNRELTLANERLEQEQAALMAAQAEMTKTCEALTQQLKEAKQQASELQEQLLEKDQEYQDELAKATRRKRRVEQWQQRSREQKKDVQDLQTRLSSEGKASAESRALALELQREKERLAAQLQAQGINQWSNASVVMNHSGHRQDMYPSLTDPRLAVLRPTFFHNRPARPPIGVMYRDGQPVVANALSHGHQQSLASAPPAFFTPTSRVIYVDGRPVAVVPQNGQQQQSMLQPPSTSDSSLAETGYPGYYTGGNF